MRRRTDEDGPVIRIIDDAPIRIVADDDDEMRDGETLHVRMSMMDSARPVFDVSMHRPGFRTDNDAYLEAYRRYCADAELPSRVSDAAVRDARAEWIADMSAAWKTDARKRKRLPAPDELPDPGDDDDGGDHEPAGSGGQYNRQFRSRRERGWSAMPFKGAAADARDEYVRKLCDAWRHPPTCDFGAQPDTGSSAGELARHRRGDPSGESDPDRALGLEQRVERTRGKIWDDYRRRLEGAWRNAGSTVLVGPGPVAVVARAGRADPGAEFPGPGPGAARSSR
jgi:hypothetical protein